MIWTGADILVDIKLLRSHELQSGSVKPTENSQDGGDM